MPAASRLHTIYPTVNLTDAYAIGVPADATSDPETLARFVFSSAPPWVIRLMAVRDFLAARLGLKTAGSLRSLSDPHSGPRVGIFRIYEKTTHEIVMGEDDTHLDFRLSVFYEPKNTAAQISPRIVISTVVNCHNLVGRAYLKLIAPVHRTVVPSFLRQAARTGWPQQTSAKH